MRIRRKKWAKEELDNSKFYIDKPEEFKGKKSALLYGVFSGVVEPIAAIIVVFTAAHTKNVIRFEPLLTGFSLATVLMITIELLKDCKKKHGVVTISAVLTTIFNMAFNRILG